MVPESRGLVTRLSTKGFFRGARDRALEFQSANAFLYLRQSTSIAGVAHLRNSRVKFRVLVSFLLFGTIQIVEAVTIPCSLTRPRLSVPRADIFTEQQEQWLGDAQAAMIEPRYTILPENESAYLDEIGKRLLDQLPPTAIHYTFRVFESPELRAFSAAGGHIYISRKLIMDAQSEDELAAMLAQEIGRVYIHHSASVVTLEFDKLMHVKTLGDEADVYDKFERLLNFPLNITSQLSPDDQRRDDLLADQVGLYAMIKAQYAPEAFATFLDRVNDNGGFSGNLFTDLFDMTPTVSIRVRMAHKTIDALPDSCRRPRPVYRPGFEPFRDALQTNRINPIVPATPGLDSFALKSPMNPALENVILSPDGKYGLAQDQYQIHVLSTSPPKVLFSVDALDAEMAQFTPDSKFLVLNYNDLHIEKWDLASGQPASISDFVDYAGCVQTSLSPDGNVMACISYNGDYIWLKLVDVTTDRMLYENMQFFEWDLRPFNRNVRFNPNFEALMRWTTDGRYFVAASGTSAMAYDLKNHQEVKLHKTLSGLAQQRFAFVGSDRLISTCDLDVRTGSVLQTFHMCYTTFPEGKALSSFQMPSGWLSGISAGDFVLFGPVAGSAAALVDPANGKVRADFKMETVDLVNDEVASEVQSGGVAFGKLGGGTPVVKLPVTPLAAIEAEAFSPNGRYLAVSNRARGAEWDMTTGERIALTAPFRAVALDEQGNLQASLIDHELEPGADVNIDKRMHKYTSRMTAAVDPVQYGSIRIQIKPLGVDQVLDSDVDLEANDAKTEAHLWTKRFDDSLPEIIPVDGDKMLFVMDRQRSTSTGEAGHDRKQLVQTSDMPKEFLYQEGTVIEIVANRTGEVKRAVIAPQLPSLRREERTADLFGNLLAVYGNSNDTTIYRTSDGKRLLAFFGRALAGDEELGMVAATNRPQELTIYNFATGKILATFKLDHVVLAAHFVLAEKQLLALTATQHVYRFDLRTLSAQGEK
jgi:hypothetical protein